MTRSRAFNRFHRWTAKVRRHHLRAALPESLEGQPIAPCPGAELRRRAWQVDQLDELETAQTELLEI
ncbi:hypothetical protein [Synechococcus sp. CBW1006]|uniref:hypothetical protein n=1 Tax=Synechococcus sp. CBW1006 TaxID=1353138 RepID=UPI0018CE83D3|nr:hypothetical protein [Synechococcus sp. CBW1006]QPN65561.1 hypothetical protein H8F26_11425 [Synechococcus sp. CBW1006]